MRIRACSENHIACVKMVAMRMSNEYVFDKVALNAVFRKVMVGVGWKVYKQVIVYHCLRARTYILSALFSRHAAIFAVAEKSGKTLCRRSSKVCQFHKSLLEMPVYTLF